MSDWESDVNATNVRRTGDDHSIYRITVEVERMRRDHNAYSRVSYELTCTVRDEDGRAALKKTEDTSNNSLLGVSVGHLSALLPAVEDAVAAVPDVERVESLERSIERRRPDRAE